MIVAELEDVLAYLPQDLGICIRGAAACRHITAVVKQGARRVYRQDITDAVDLACKASTVLLPSGSHPPMLVLEASASAPLWCHAWADEVDFTLEGRWPAKAARRG